MQLQTNFYDNPIYFAITFNGKSTFILEPDNWNKISLHIPRDPEFYGFWSDFLEDKYGMLFTYLKDGDRTGGAALLSEIYETPGYGSNAEVFFSVGNLIGNTPVKINEWRINLNVYNSDFGGVHTSIEKMPFQGKLRARFSEPCTINGNFTMDGENLSPINTSQLRLHSKTLVESSQSISVSPQTTNQIVDADDLYYIIQPDQSNLAINELTEVFSQQVGLIVAGGNPSTSGTPAPPGGTPPFTGTADIIDHPFLETINQYTPTTSGQLTIAWEGSAIMYWFGTGGIQTKWWDVTPRVVQFRMLDGVLTPIAIYTGTTQTMSMNSGGSPPPSSPLVATVNFKINTAGQSYILPGVSGSTQRQQVNQIKNWMWNEQWTFQVESGDLIYVQHVMCPPFANSHFSSIFMQFDQFVNNIKYTQLTTTVPSTCEAFRIKDFLTQQVEALTGQKNAVIAPIFDKGGFGYNYLLANGYAIRNYGADIYRPKVDLKKILKSLQAIFCLGVGIKKIAGVEYLYVDKVSNFFNNNVIAKFDDTFLWKTVQNSQYVYNKVDLGYNKYRGLNLLQEDEFNTEGRYLLQYLKYADNILSCKSDIIGSGYLLESQRRMQFQANQQQSLEFDNDIFIIPTSEPNKFLGLNIVVLEIDSNPVIQFSQNMAMFAGDVVTLYIGGLIGNIDLLIGNEVEGFPITGQDQYYVQNYRFDWISGTSYLRSDTIFNVSDSLFYICIANVSGSTNPSSDATHWQLWGYLIGTWDVLITPPSPNIVFAERNQCFEICQNVIDPSTIYGGRISLKHILYNWRPILGVALSQVDLDSTDTVISQIITNLVRMNSLFTTKFLSTEPNKGNVQDLTLVELNRENIRDYLAEGQNVFTQTGATCQIKIGNNQMDEIRMALAGETSDPTKDNGGLVLKDDNGIYWFCQVMDIQYNLVKEIATLMVQLCYQVAR